MVEAKRRGSATVRDATLCIEHGVPIVSACLYDQRFFQFLRCTDGHEKSTISSKSRNLEILDWGMHHIQHMCYHRRSGFDIYIMGHGFFNQVSHRREYWITF